MKASRRDFLKTSGVLLVGLRTLRAQGPLQGSPPLNQLDSWISIAADGSITAYSGKEELGQGISTAQQQLVAEELSVPFNRVKLIYCDTALTPDQAHTSGSQSHPANFNTDNLAQAGATAREALFRMASQKLGVPVERLTASDGVISGGAKSVTYGQLVEGKKFSLALDSKAKRKSPSQWTVLGKPIPRPDIPDLVTGKFEFVHNVRLPGMLHGRVVRPPSISATVASVDESSVAGMPGLVKVVVKKNFVGVVAEKPWQALQAAGKLKVTWHPGPPLPDQATFHDSLRRLPARDALMVDSGDVDAKLSGAGSTVLKATYLHPYQMHGSMGSSCSVADVQGDRATIYSATQAVWYQKSTSAMILGLKPENIHVIFRRGSGCYGVNGADTVTYDAAILSQAVGKPVRVQLTRKDEMAFENYGPAYVLDQRASLDANGNIATWDHESWSPGLGNRPGTNRPGNIITGFLLGFPPADFAPRSAGPPPPGAPARVNNNSNGVPSYLASVTGTVQSGRVLTHTVESRFFTGPLRSPARLQNTFAHESFMDELAAKVKADPVEYRLRHLRDARLKEVLQAAAKGANWETRPSPRPGNRKTGIATGRGAASVLYEGDNGYTALVAEIEVNQDTGKIVVKRMVAASDVGPISNPDGLRNQVEGGALQGLSRCLGEEVTWDNEKITSVDWRTYHSLPLGFEVPKIDAVLINRTEGEVMGAGETSITLVAAAIGNAIFDATGARIRQVPFTAERIKAALAARA
ncbi:MAG TPA: molybdopterin cofactor-binding domain-containing protein [Bryobacteraceae bacterium]|jgi:CO/xanthine dehydrogenase Mo-binding subunit|nr:molybdopterin cofactor-binding domain-containing protein [Bryobacteraceae bacterium]